MCKLFVLGAALLVIGLAGSPVVYSQQTPLFTQYFLNPFLYNPALTGANENPAAWMLYRRQWAGVDGAPETQVFTLDAPLRKQPVGLGLTFFNDVTNIIGRTSGALTAAYTASLSSRQKLSFGMSLVAIRNRIFFDRIRADDTSDPNLLATVDQRTVFESNAGLHYSIGRLRVGFSGEQLFQSTVRYRNEALFRSLDYTFVRHYYTTLAYRFRAGAALAVRPMVLVRTVQGLPSQPEMSLLFDYHDLIWANVNYRHKVGAGVAVGFCVDEQFVFGYSYEFPTTDLNILGSITHEFALGLKLGKPKETKLATVSAGQPTEREYERIDQLQQQNELMSRRLTDTERQLERQNEELALLTATVDGYARELARAIVELQATPADTVPEESRRLYLVVGALRTIENAKLFQRILKREAGLDTRVVQSGSGTWYFVYTREVPSVAEGNLFINELRKGKASAFFIGQPWIYKGEQP